MLETCILSRQMNLREALKTAMGMSFISMVAMELAMNAVDVVFAGGVFSMLGHSINASCWFFYSFAL